MKVLFAVNDENVSEEIVKKYQKDYKEIISYKNVYYFNAIIKEIQRDKSYDRIVIGEDLEPFANNNYDTIDKFLFEKLDNISDEATDNGEKDAQIILICSDRRGKSDKLLVKLFGIGVYSAIIGKDRSIEEVCRLINNPRTKKEAKQYYHIDSDEVDYKAENDTDVNENEIQSILKHYKSLGKNEDRYVESFENIASQYTDAQLRVIIKFLPMNVKAVLEERSPKYQQLVMFGDMQYKKNDTSNIVKNNGNNRAKSKKNANQNIGTLEIDSLDARTNNNLAGKPIIIPAAAKIDKADEIEKKLEEISNSDVTIETDRHMIAQEEPQEEVKKGRGRPRKIVDETMLSAEPAIKRGRGRPKKISEGDIILPGTSSTEWQEELQQNESVLPGLSYEEENNNAYTLPGVDEHDEKPYETSNTFIASGQNEYESDMNQAYNNIEPNDYNNELENANQNGYYNYSNNLDNLITGDKKIVAFVGTSKNGTSFIVNNLAMLLSSMGINTAILDLTENKNSYYIYTKNEEELRKIAYTSMEKLKQGTADGINVNKNLSVYTALPGEADNKNDAQNIIKTLVNNHNVVLLDCDFNTGLEYFGISQEIYLVQSMDILTIQPLTAFLRDLKNEGIALQEKIRIVINKNTKIKGLNERVLIGGMAFYNAPSMSFMTELFDKDKVKVCAIPLDVSTYTAYLEAMVSCEISLNHYSKYFMQSLRELAEIVYPLINKKTYKPMDNKRNKQEMQKNDYFSEDMNSTLEQMSRMKNRKF